MYYNDKNIIGMPLASITNDDGTFTFDLFWDNESLNYEILSENILDDLELFISPMSVAVLIDTGW